MKKIASLLFLFTPLLLSAQLWTAQSVTVNTTNPDSCTAVSIDVQAYMGCINFSVRQGTFTVVGTAITLQVNCVSSPICAGAISYPVTSFTLNNLSPANYSITAEAYLDGVLTNSITGGNLNVAPCTTVDLAEQSLSDLKVYPNPSSNKIYIDELRTGTENVQIQLFDILGSEQSIPMRLNDNRLELDVSRLAEGIYFLQINSGDKKLIKKIIVN